jgi:hypothetical protein
MTASSASLPSPHRRGIDVSIPKCLANVGEVGQLKIVISYVKREENT